jgi:hypothetical protein
MEMSHILEMSPITLFFSIVGFYFAILTCVVMVISGCRFNLKFSYDRLFDTLNCVSSKTLTDDSSTCSENEAILPEVCSTKTASHTNTDTVADDESSDTDILEDEKSLDTDTFDNAIQYVPNTLLQRRSMGVPSH